MRERKKGAEKEGGGLCSVLYTVHGFLFPWDYGIILGIGCGWLLLRIGLDWIGLHRSIIEGLTMLCSYQRALGSWLLTPPSADNSK